MSLTCLFRRALQVVCVERPDLSRDMVFQMHPSSIQGVEDMSTLAELHEAAIMHNLYLRYQKDLIYVSHGLLDLPSTTVSVSKVCDLHEMMWSICSEK